VPPGTRRIDYVLEAMKRDGMTIDRENYLWRALRRLGRRMGAGAGSRSSRGNSGLGDLDRSKNLTLCTM
jgi:hypothetical protein